MLSQAQPTAILELSAKGVTKREIARVLQLSRLTHHVHILEMNGDSYRLKTSKQKRAVERAR